MQNFIIHYTGGQSSTGSVLSWARRSLFASKRNDISDVNGKSDHSNYKELDAEASDVDIGADGLLALETFQGSLFPYMHILRKYYEFCSILYLIGSRTPVTDPLARGCLLGLSLLHTRGHIWRALMVCIFNSYLCSIHFTYNKI